MHVYWLQDSGSGLLKSSHASGWTLVKVLRQNWWEFWWCISKKINKYHSISYILKYQYNIERAEQRFLNWNLSKNYIFIWFRWQYYNSTPWNHNNREIKNNQLPMLLVIYLATKYSCNIVIIKKKSKNEKLYLMVLLKKN